MDHDSRKYLDTKVPKFSWMQARPLKGRDPLSPILSNSVMSKPVGLAGRFRVSVRAHFDEIHANYRLV